MIDSHDNLRTKAPNIYSYTKLPCIPKKKQEKKIKIKLPTIHKKTPKTKESSSERADCSVTSPTRPRSISRALVSHPARSYTPHGKKACTHGYNTTKPRFLKNTCMVQSAAVVAQTLPTALRSSLLLQQGNQRKINKLQHSSGGGGRRDEEIDENYRKEHSKNDSKITPERQTRHPRQTRERLQIKPSKEAFFLRRKQERRAARLTQRLFFQVQEFALCCGFLSGHNPCRHAHAPANKQGIPYMHPPPYHNAHPHTCRSSYPPPPRPYPSLAQGFPCPFTQYRNAHPHLKYAGVPIPPPPPPFPETIRRIFSTHWSARQPG